MWFCSVPLSSGGFGWAGSRRAMERTTSTVRSPMTPFIRRFPVARRSGGRVVRHPIARTNFPKARCGFAATTGAATVPCRTVSRRVSLRPKEALADRGGPRSSNLGFRPR